jgi:hypothetical protein
MTIHDDNIEVKKKKMRAQIHRHPKKNMNIG